MLGRSVNYGIKPTLKHFAVFKWGVQQVGENLTFLLHAFVYFIITCHKRFVYEKQRNSNNNNKNTK